MTSSLDIINKCDCFLKLLGLEKDETLDIEKIKYNQRYTKNLIEKRNKDGTSMTRAYLLLIITINNRSKQTISVRNEQTKEDNINGQPTDTTNKGPDSLEGNSENATITTNLEIDSTQKETTATDQTAPITAEQAHWALSSILPPLQTKPFFKKTNQEDYQT